MSDNIREIKDEINLDLLSVYCGEFAENMQYSDPVSPALLIY